MAKHTYTILSMMKDEGHSLVEWVAYHTHLGFDNIVVYTNNCSDGTDDMLIRLEEMGWVQHFRNDVPEGKKPQPNALSLASQNPEVIDSEWILTMDADEFLSIKVGRGWISDIVERMDPAASAMAITWRFFGSNGISEWNPGLVIENYTRAAPDMFKKGWGVKTLFKPFRDMKLGIHRPHIKKAKQEPENAKRLFDQLWLNGSGDPMPDEFSLSGWRSTKPTLGYKWAELNHYAVKSYEAYLLRRVRGNVNNKPDKYNDAYFAMFDRNEEEHTNVQRHLRGTKKRMAKILSDPVMRDLQDRALAFHRDRVRILREGGEYDTWLAELKEAAKVPIDALDEVLFVQHLPKEWQEKVKELQAQGVPDKQIAKMISQTQTAKKGETRQELLRAAGHNPEDRLDSHSFKARGDGDAENLDNPFMGTEAADGLGVPLTQERTQKIALAAQAAGGDDPRAADLLKKAEAAKKALAAEQSRRAAPPAAEASPEAEAPTTEATVDISDPAPPINHILDAATLSVSEGVQSPPDTVPKPTGPEAAATSGSGSGTAPRAKTKSAPTKGRGAGAAGSKSGRATSTGKAAKAKSGGTSSGKASGTTSSKSAAKSRTTKSTSRRSANRSTSAKS
ncbi:glycosyltransferase family 2 protein [Salibaculum halophilum]|uniref:glycosyltransferase family 2 protein n=1 Tax=Salibaculum halophilum TaxID=1914408 RepID=UPI001FE2AC65|nr:glycosyltransferase family 2 protein [Salibaculum halophilum]